MDFDLQWLLLGLPPEGEYEVRGLVAAAARRPLWCLRVDDLAWAEIDDEGHLERARGLALTRRQA